MRRLKIAYYGRGENRVLSCVVIASVKRELLSQYHRLTLLTALVHSLDDHTRTYDDSQWCRQDFLRETYKSERFPCTSEIRAQRSTSRGSPAERLTVVSPTQKAVSIRLAATGPGLTGSNALLVVRSAF